MKSRREESSQPLPGGWTPWQLTLYSATLAFSTVLWSLPHANTLLIALVAILLPVAHNRTWQRSAAAIAILVLIAILVPGRVTPEAPLLAALAFCILTPRATPIPQVLAIAALWTTLTMSPPAQWPWILVALPVLIPPRLIPGIGDTQEHLFYDGHCGLCHHTVTFLLAEDFDGSRFRFAPLDSETFRRTVPEFLRQSLPDSVVVWIPGSQQALTRSAAALHVMRRLGGYWRLLATVVGAVVPTSLLDRVYDAVARARKRIFRTPQQACPIIPKELRSRFDLS